MKGHSRRKWGATSEATGEKTHRSLMPGLWARGPRLTKTSPAGMRGSSGSQPGLWPWRSGGNSPCGSGSAPSCPGHPAAKPRPAPGLPHPARLPGCPAARPPARSRPRRAATSHGTSPEPDAQRNAGSVGEAASARFRLEAVGDTAGRRTSARANRAEVGAPRAPRSARAGSRGGGSAGTASGWWLGLRVWRPFPLPVCSPGCSRTGARSAARQHSLRAGGLAAPLQL